MTPEQNLEKQIAKNKNLAETQVKLATRSIFEFVASVIESGERKPVRIPKFGLFSCKPKRVEFLEEKGLL